MLVRCAPVKGRPSTLSGGFIRDLPTVTGSGKARDFRNARDHAMIRILTEGVRRAELAQTRMADLPADLIATPYVRVVPLKGARAEDEGRNVPVTPETARAIVTYLRTRRSHAKADLSPALWLGTRNRGPMTGSGAYRMIKTRAEEAGYDPTAYPHMFRHTFAHDWTGRRRGRRPDAPDGLEGPLHARPVRRRHASPARHRSQAPPRPDLLSAWSLWPLSYRDRDTEGSGDPNIVAVMSNQDSPVLPDGWSRPEPEHAAALEREAAVEIAPGHQLHGQALTVIAACQACDHVAFQTTAGFAIVHPSWIGHQDRPPWPSAHVLDSRPALEAAMAAHQH